LLRSSGKRGKLLIRDSWLVKEKRRQAAAVHNRETKLLKNTDLKVGHYTSGRTMYRGVVPLHKLQNGDTKSPLHKNGRDLSRRSIRRAGKLRACGCL